MAKRTALLGMLICLIGAAAFAQPAVIAPNTGGDIGLFTMPTADGPRAGTVHARASTAGTRRRSPASSTRASPTRPRYFAHYGGAASIGLGLTNWWSIFAAGGGEATKSGGDWQGGIINGIPVADRFKVTEGSQDPDRHEDPAFLRGRSGPPLRLLAGRPHPGRAARSVTDRRRRRSSASTRAGPTGSGAAR